MLSKLVFLFLEKQNCLEFWLIHSPASGSSRGLHVLCRFSGKAITKRRQTNKNQTVLPPYKKISKQTHTPYQPQPQTIPSNRKTNPQWTIILNDNSEPCESWVMSILEIQYVRKNQPRIPLLVARNLFWIIQAKTYYKSSHYTMQSLPWKRLIDCKHCQHLSHEMFWNSVFT